MHFNVKSINGYASDNIVSILLRAPCTMATYTTDLRFSKQNKYALRKQGKDFNTARKGFGNQKATILTRTFLQLTN